MNILLTVHHYLNPNAGAEGVTMQLAEAYRRMGHRAELFAYDHLPRKLPFGAKRLLFPYYVNKTLQETRIPYDVVDASSGDAWVWAAAARGGRKRTTTLVSRSHGLEHLVHEVLVRRSRAGEHRLSWKYPFYHGGYRLWEVARSFRKADGAVFLNRAEQQYGRDKFGLAAGAVIGNGIPACLLGLEAEDTPSADAAGDIGVAVIGRYDPLKGTADAAKALTPLLLLRHNLRVTFLGTQREASRILEDYPDAVRSRIFVVPKFRHEELPELLKGHYIKLFPTLKEGFGNTLVEAMACGLAPVTTRIPGPSDIVTDGRDGFLAEPGDAEGMGRILASLLDDRALLDRVRKEAYRTAQRYGWDDIARRTLAYYEACRERKRSGWSS